MGVTCSTDRSLDVSLDHGSLATLTEDPILLEMGFDSRVSRLYDVVEVLTDEQNGLLLCKVRRKDGLSESIHSSNNNDKRTSAPISSPTRTEVKKSSSFNKDLLNRSYLLQQIVTDNPVVLLRSYQTIDLLQTLQHPNLPRLMDVHEDEQHHNNHGSSRSTVSFVMECCDGGHILERQQQRRNGSRYYTEAQTRKIFLQILEVVQYLHSQDIVHGDLRAEWFQFESADPKQYKLQLMELSSMQQQPNAPRALRDDHEVCRYGTAPEYLLNGRTHSKAGDMWSVGIILYQMLGGKHPFGDNSVDLHGNMRIGNAPPTFEEPEWNRVSSSAKDLLQKLLNLEPKARLPAEQALKHSWLTSRYGGLSLSIH